MFEILIPVIISIISVLGTLATIKYKHILEKKKKDTDCPINKCVYEDLELLNKLEDILDDIEADRVSIYSFHNGGEFYSGKSMQKMSMSYEVVSNGTSRVQTERQAIPVSACIATLKPLMDAKSAFYPTLQKYPESLCKVYLVEDGVESTYQWSILDLNGRAIGILRIDFVKKQKKLSNKILDDLTLDVIKMPGYLESWR